MVGKTNLTFISKGDASSVQLIQKSYATDATGEVYKMEVINNRFFAYVSASENGKKNVLMGADVGNMSFVRKDNGYLEATHIIYIEDNYYIVKNGDVCTEILKTNDFNEYEQVNFTIEGNWLGIFLDSRERAILVSYDESYATWTRPIKIYICDSLKDITNATISAGVAQIENDYNTCLLNNRIFFLDGRQISLAGECTKPEKGWKRSNYAGGYFFYAIHSVGGMELYRSRDLKMITSYPGFFPNISDQSAVQMIPINGKYCLSYVAKNDSKRYINVADDILSVGQADNAKIEMADDLIIVSILEDDGKTYVGTSNGIIYELQLDYEGIMQRPDVAIIKILAAKQALAQSLQYTDDCITELKSYIDSKFEDDSTKVQL